MLSEKDKQAALRVMDTGSPVIINGYHILKNMGALPFSNQLIILDNGLLIGVCNDLDEAQASITREVQK